MSEMLHRANISREEARWLWTLEIAAENLIFHARTAADRKRAMARLKDLLTEPEATKRRDMRDL